MLEDINICLRSCESLAKSQVKEASEVSREVMISKYIRMTKLRCTVLVV